MEKTEPAQNCPKWKNRTGTKLPKMEKTEPAPNCPQ